MENDTSQPFAYCTIELPIDDVIDSLFASNGDGTLVFGYSARSIESCEPTKLESGVDFRDYILEGFVRYRLRLLPATIGSTICIETFGCNRDYAIIPAFRLYLKAAKIDKYAIAMVDPQSAKA